MSELRTESSANEQIAAMIQQLGRSHTAMLQEQLKPLGLMPGQLPALQLLWQQDGQTQAAMVAQLQVEQATMANTLARMEKSGLIKRRKADHDGRIRYIHLTAKAHDLEPSARAAVAAAEEAFLSPLRPGQQKRLAEFLAVLAGGEGMAED